MVGWCFSRPVDEYSDSHVQRSTLYWTAYWAASLHKGSYQATPVVVCETARFRRLGVIRRPRTFIRHDDAEDTIHFALGFMVVTLYTSPFLL
jgi:hypothetical protein